MADGVWRVADGGLRQRLQVIAGLGSLPISLERTEGRREDGGRAWEKR